MKISLLSSERLTRLAFLESLREIEIGWCSNDLAKRKALPTRSLLLSCESRGIADMQMVKRLKSSKRIVGDKYSTKSGNTPYPVAPRNVLSYKSKNF